MSKILALDTSTQACSVALWLDGEVREDFRDLPRQHTQLLLPMVQQMLDQAGLSLKQLDGIAFGRGPGSFTGLRICTGVTQGLAFGANLPVAPVSTLAALALQARHGNPELEGALAAIDARMDELYWGAYRFDTDTGLPLLVADERVCPPEHIEEDTLFAQGRWVGVGSGWNYRDRLPASVLAWVETIDPLPEPRAAAIAELGAAMIAAGQGVLPEQALPVYLRDDVAKKKGEQKKADQKPAQKKGEG
ncbi:tRNA (adenosine(37)-N6)-threonylcarbamoyltransferase complex dimerization subunit type 1 TsaB [Motiliproteus sp.]|uniref:tRNA (adenosine(37)-N6)-threonylcarbamoyltransferase complex dimerization subunit type 1 TsaB n=1 Tax=Motiliproteus sp. TaxID=1898955 RepID=UPI003BACBB6E